MMCFFFTFPTKTPKQTRSFLVQVQQNEMQMMHIRCVLDKYLICFHFIIHIVPQGNNRKLYFRHARLSPYKPAKRVTFSGKLYCFIILHQLYTKFVHTILYSQ